MTVVSLADEAVVAVAVVVVDVVVAVLVLVVLQVVSLAVGLPPVSLFITNLATREPRFR